MIIAKLNREEIQHISEQLSMDKMSEDADKIFKNTKNGIVLNKQRKKTMSWTASPTLSKPRVAT